MFSRHACDKKKIIIYRNSSEDSVGEDPVEVSVHPSVDAGLVGVTTTDSPGHNTDVHPATIAQLMHQWTTGVTLRKFS